VIFLLFFAGVIQQLFIQLLDDVLFKVEDLPAGFLERFVIFEEVRELGNVIVALGQL
jgi:hypothetical protein